jgi:hypothetical protein
MTLTDWYEKGMTFDQYCKSMQVNQQVQTRVYQQLEFKEQDLALFKEVAKQNLRGIVLTADWCGDAALCVPILQRIAEESKIELRFLIRDENLELMDQYLTNGTARSIPMFIFIEQEGVEKSVWGPRSSEVQDLVSSLRSELPQKDAHDFEEKQQQMYRQFKEKVTSDPSIWRTVVESVKVKLMG